MEHPEAPRIPVLLDSPHRNVETLVREDILPPALQKILPLSRMIALTREQRIVDFSKGNVEDALENIPNARLVVHELDYRYPADENAIYLARKQADRTGRKVEDVLYVTNDGKPGHTRSAEVNPEEFFQKAVDPFAHEVLTLSGRER